MLPGLLLLIGLTHLIVPTRTLQTDKEYIHFAEEYLDGIEAAEAYARILSRDSTNTRIQIAFAKTWHRSNKRQRVFLADQLKHEGILPSDIYQRCIEGEQSDVRNAGFYGLACLAFFDERPHAARALLDSISTRDLDGLAYLNGRVAIKLKENDRACSFFKQEIARGGMIEEAWRFAILCEGPISAARIEKVKEEVGNSAIPNKYYRYIQYSNGTIGGYFRAVFQQWVNGFHFPGVIVALLVLILWSVYLMQLNRLAEVRYSAQLLALVGGIASVVFVFIMGDVFHFSFGMGYQHSPLGTFLRTIFDIGLIEETSKLIPVVLVLLVFRKSDWSPASIVALASMAGLGFTFSEDSSYFDSKSLDIITSRSLITGCLHMAWSSIAVYGFVQFKFRSTQRGKYWLIVFYFLLAVVLHGLYDYWLIEDTVYRLRFLSIVISALSILLWVTFYTNALNNSNAYAKRDVSGMSRLNIGLLVIFSGIIYLEYLVNALIYGPSPAWEVFSQNFESALIAVPVLAFSLSAIDIAPGGWISVDTLINRYIQPGRELFNCRFKLRPYSRTADVGSLFPETGRIVKRLTIQEDNAWYLFESSIEHVRQAVLIRAKKEATNLVKGESIVHVRLPSADLDLDRTDFELAEFKFLGWGVLEVESDRQSAKSN